MNIIKRHYKWILLVALMVNVFLFMYIYKWEYRKPLLEIYFFSLNKGRSVFVRTPMDKTILIGGGQNSEVIREITKSMPFYSRKIDYVIVPSATPAQIGGLTEIVERYEVGTVIKPKIMATSTVLSQLMRDIGKKKIHINEVERGDSLEIEKGLEINILFPYKNFKFNKTSLPELGMSILYGSTTAYFLGNLSKTVQKYILNNSEISDGENIVEYYHNMTDSKLSAELLEKINPKFIFSKKEKAILIVSDGERWQREK